MINVTAGELLGLRPATLLAFTLKVYVASRIRLLIVKLLDTAFTSIDWDVQNGQ